MITKVRSAFLLLATALALGFLIPSAALAQATLFEDGFGPKPLAGGRCSPGSSIDVVVFSKL